MGFKPRLTTDALNALPEAQRSFYVPREGHEGEHVLDVDQVDGWALEDVGGLKNTLSAVATKRDEFKSRLEQFKDIDPNKAREALTRVEQMKDWTPTEEVQARINARVEEVKTAMETDLTTARQAAAELEKQVEQYVLDDAIDKAIARHKMVDGGPDLMRPHVRQLVELAKVEGGGYAARVKGADGQHRFSMKQGSGAKHMDVDELVDAMAKEPRFKVLFAGSGASGSGPKPGDKPTNRVGDRSGDGDGDQNAGLNPIARLAAARRAQSAGA